MVKKITLVFLSLLFLSLLLPSVAFAGEVVFDESDADYMTVSNGNYEIIFSKNNGAIDSIYDLQTESEVSSGNYLSTLWSVQISGGLSYDSSLYQAVRSNTFIYSWDEVSDTLTFFYDGSLMSIVDIQIDVVFSEDDYFDFELSMDNTSALGTISGIQFPYHLLFSEENINEVLVPDSPGLVLQSGFFNGNEAYSETYTHPSNFADFIAFDTDNGNVSFYSLWDSENFVPTTITLDKLQTGAETYDCNFGHNFATWIPSGDSWTSPVLRLRFFDEFFDAAVSCREDNGMDSFPDVSEKLGDRFEAVSQSPLFHVDPLLTGMDFDEWPSLFATLPSPSILMYSDFWTGGFHGHHPDYIPPDSDYGTVDDFRDSIVAAHDNGLMVMPFTLPSWWHVDSPTMLGLVLDIDDIATLNEEGVADESTWILGEVVERGYFVSPFVTFVHDRLEEVITELTDDYGVDFIYEDVLAASQCYWDFNPANPDPTDCTGWFDHISEYQDAGTSIVTETGYDLFTENAIGFLGGLHVIWSSMDDDYGVGNWRMYPLAQIMSHDKVLNYQYWEDYTATKEDLSWNISMGYMLNYNLIAYGICYGGCPENMDSEWVHAVGDFQKYVASRYAGKEITVYQDQDENNVTETTFDNITIVRNWSEDNDYDEGDFTIPTMGFMAISESEDLRAGVFSEYNGVELSGEHYLIEQRADDSVILRQPMGEEAEFTLALPSEWVDGDNLLLNAYGADEEVIASAEKIIADGSFTFTYLVAITEEDVSYYEAIIEADHSELEILEDLTVEGSEESEIEGISVEIPAGITLSSDLLWDETVVITGIDGSNGVEGIEDAVTIEIDAGGYDVYMDAAVVVTIPYAGFGELDNPLIKIVTASDEFEAAECSGEQYDGASYTLVSYEYGEEIGDDAHCYTYNDDNVYVATTHFSNFSAGSTSTSSSSRSSGSSGFLLVKTIKDLDPKDLDLMPANLNISVSDFSDLGNLNTTSWQYTAIQKVLEIGLFQGEKIGEAKVFNMEGSMTRGMAATVICRYMGCDENAELLEAPFPDVPVDEYYAVPVSYLKANGVVNGKTEMIFDPNGTVTRAEFFKMIAESYIFMHPEIAPEWNELLAGTTDYFPDVPANAWYMGYMNLAVEKGLLKGSIDEVTGLRYAKGEKDIIRVEAAAMIGYFIP